MQKAASLLAGTEGASSSSVSVGTQGVLIRIACFFAACMVTKLKYHTEKKLCGTKIKIREEKQFYHYAPSIDEGNCKD